MCCSGNLCNYENNVENITEINKRAQVTEGMLIRQNAKSQAMINQDQANEEINVLTDQSQRQSLLNAFSGAAKSLINEQLRNKLKKLAISAPKLEILVVSSATLQKGLKIGINALGLMNQTSERQDGPDGIVYFGRKLSIRTGTNDPNAEITNNQKLVVNDFLIPSKSEQQAEQQRGRHFQIKFDHEQLKYFIKDLGIGHGVFVKQETPIHLKDNMIVNVGEAHIVVNLIENEIEDHMNTQENTEQLKLKIFGGPQSGEIYYFKNEGQEIIVGRQPNCDIRIDDKLLSKNQCHIKYMDKGNWVLFDGYGGKPSTNGTWIYLNEDYEMQDGMTFKANQTIFNVKISK